MWDQQIRVLEEFVTENRRTRMATVLDNRTRYVTVMLEDIYQPHNASAVLRSCDAFGVQDVHIVENRNSYQVNPGVELGTSQWLNLIRCKDGTEACIETLRNDGYRIVATTPHRNGATIDSFDLTAGPCAIMFGTEKDGLSDAALANADEYLRIPMVGFVESLNISVSAALTLYALTTRLRESEIARTGTRAGALAGTEVSWRLQSEERHELYYRWLRKSVRNADAILAARIGTTTEPRERT